MDEQTFLQDTLSQITDDNSLTTAIGLIKDFYRGNLVEAKKKMIFNSNCSGCQLTEVILVELTPPRQDEA